MFLFFKIHFVELHSQSRLLFRCAAHCCGVKHVVCDNIRGQSRLVHRHIGHLDAADDGAGNTALADWPRNVHTDRVQFHNLSQSIGGHQHEVRNCLIIITGSKHSQTTQFDHPLQMHPDDGATATLPLRHLRSGGIRHRFGRLSDAVEGGPTVPEHRRAADGTVDGVHDDHVLPPIGDGQKHTQLHRIGAGAGRHLCGDRDLLPCARLERDARPTTVRTGCGTVLRRPVQHR